MYEQIEEILIEVIGLANKERLRESSDLIADGILDSYSLIEVVVRIQDKLGFAFPDEKLAPEEFRTVLSLSALCAELAGESSASEDDA